MTGSIPLFFLLVNLDNSLESVLTDHYVMDDAATVPDENGQWVLKFSVLIQKIKHFSGVRHKLTDTFLYNLDLNLDKEEELSDFLNDSMSLDDVVCEYFKPQTLLNDLYVFPHASVFFILKEKEPLANHPRLSLQDLEENDMESWGETVVPLQRTHKHYLVASAAAKMARTTRKRKVVGTGV